MMRNLDILCCTLLSTLLLSPLLIAEELEDEPLRCISVNRIKSVDVLNNQQIIFRMVGGKNLINVLPHRCHGLRRNRPFMYRISTNRLCDLDFITVLDQGGFGFRPMGSCGLGTFEPMLDDEIKTLKNEIKAEKKGGDKKVPTDQE